MDATRVRRFAWFLIATVVFVGAAWAAERTWTDKTGKFKVDAEFVKVEDGKAVLRRSNGKEVSVPLAKLSEADQDFVKAHAKGGAAAPDAINNELAAIAVRFYSDLRNQERTVARQSLTKKAEELMSAGQSPLAGLPQPESGKKAIKTLDAKLDDAVAEIPVLVRAGGQVHKTKLHLRKEGDQWRVFALSATYPDGEKSINFEAVAAPQTSVDPLLTLVGMPLELEGVTLDGTKVSTAQQKGKIVLVDFWATWCGPCRAEIPNIRANWDKYHESGFDVMAVSVDEDLKALASFVAEEKPPWTVVADNHPRNQKSMGGKFGIRAIPAFVLAGRDGKVAAVNCRGERLEQELKKLLAAK